MLLRESCPPSHELRGPVRLHSSPPFPRLAMGHCVGRHIEGELYNSGVRRHMASLAERKYTRSVALGCAAAVEPFTMETRWPPAHGASFRATFLSRTEWLSHRPPALADVTAGLALRV